MFSEVPIENLASMKSDRTGPLRDVRIVDLTQALAGPFCTMLLADLGADVIKVEAPGGDGARKQIPSPPDRDSCDYGGYFASINRNKRSIVIDLKTDEGKRTLLRLAEHADVLVENFRSGVMDRLGVGYEAVRERNARLVYAAIRGFGDPRTGESPYNGWPAFDVVAQCMGGIVGINGPAGTSGSRCGASVGDLFPGTLCALGIVAAVNAARASGEGQFLDVGMYDGVLALCENMVYRYSYQGDILSPQGSGHPALYPFDVFQTADGACAIAAPVEHQWAVLCRAMGREDLIDDERSRNNLYRVRNRDFVSAQINAWTGGKTTAEIVAALEGEVSRRPDEQGRRHLQRSARQGPRDAGAGAAARRRQRADRARRKSDQDDRHATGRLSTGSAVGRAHRRDSGRAVRLGGTGELSEQLDHPEVPIEQLDELTLRRRCAELCETLPEIPRIKTIAHVGALDCMLGAKDVDSVRMARALDYLLRSGVVVDPEFEIDVINLYHGRDFLAEDSKADMVFVSFVPNVDHRLFPIIEAEVLASQKKELESGRESQERSFFWHGRSSRHRASEWYRRVCAADCRLLLTFGGEKEVKTQLFDQPPFVTVIPTPKHLCHASFFGLSRPELYQGIDWDIPYKWLGLLVREDVLATRPDPAAFEPRTMLASALAELAAGTDDAH